MLDNLKTNLRAAIKKIVRSSTVDEELIKELAIDLGKIVTRHFMSCPSNLDLKIA